MKLHSKKDIYYYYKLLFFSFIPLLIFGIVKNGLMLCKETSDIYIILKPVIYLIINICLGFIVDLIVFKEKKINKFLVYLTILYMISSLNTPLWLYILGDVILIILLLKDKNIINKIALVGLITYGINYLLNTNQYGNIAELSGKYIFSFIDNIFLRQVGGISTSNLVLVAILLIIMLFNILYKKNIALFGLLSYILYFVIMAILKDANLYTKLLINSTALFEIIIIGTLNEYTPYSKKGEIIYGLLLGLLGGLLGHYISINIGILLAILVLTPFKILFEKKAWFY